MSAKIGRQELSYTAGNIYFRKSGQLLKKLSIHLFYDSSFPLLSAYTQKMKAYVHTKTLYTDVHSSFFKNSQKLEAIQVPNYRWTDKQVISLHFKNKKEWNIDTSHNIDKSFCWIKETKKEVYTECFNYHKTLEMWVMTER